MFNIIVTSDTTAWETDQVMRMDGDRFMESGSSEGPEAARVRSGLPESLSLLENTPTLLFYEQSDRMPAADVIRFGKVRNVHRDGSSIGFLFYRGRPVYEGNTFGIQGAAAGMGQPNPLGNQGGLDPDGNDAATHSPPIRRPPTILRMVANRSVIPQAMFHAFSSRTLTIRFNTRRGCWISQPGS
jgi:hypothetical protein